MERTQFTFYESFYKAAVRMESKEDQADFYNAVCAYALYGKDPDTNNMSGVSAIAFELSKPNLASSRRKANSGKKGGSKKATPSKTEANGKQTASKEHTSKDVESEGCASEIENKRENKIEIENECYPPTPLVGGVVANVLSDYLNRINPAASPYSLDELKGYAEVLGEAVCKRAFDIALDNKAAKWQYIKAILSRLQSQGVRCLADWEALERERENKGNAFSYDYGSTEGSL